MLSSLLLYKHFETQPTFSNESLLIVLGRYAFPALIPPGLEHEPASARLHPFPKPVRFRAATIVRLVCPLWHFSAPSKTLNLTQKPCLKAAGFVVENAKWKC